MKIIELLEDIIPNRKTVSLNREFDADRELDPRNKLGSGFFSVARPDRNDPHMIKKYNHNFDVHDPFSDYIEYIIDNQLTANPYFPRVYDIKTITDKKGQKVNKYTIEKLIDPKTLRSEEIQSIIERTFKPDVVNDIVIISDKKHNIQMYKGKAGSLHATWVSKLYSAITHSDTSNIIDDSLKQAIEIIIKIIKNKNACNDLHANNVMYRRTKYGIQAVLSDPLA